MSLMDAALVPEKIYETMELCIKPNLFLFCQKCPIFLANRPQLIIYFFIILRYCALSLVPLYGVSSYLVLSIHSLKLLHFRLSLITDNVSTGCRVVVVQL